MTKAPTTRVGRGAECEDEGWRTKMAAPDENGRLARCRRQGPTRARAWLPAAPVPNPRPAIGLPAIPGHLTLANLLSR